MGGKGVFPPTTHLPTSCQITFPTSYSSSSRRWHSPLPISAASPPWTPYRLHLPISPSISIQSPPPQPPEYIQQQQLKNIIDTLIGAGDFTAWANILFNPNTNSSIPTTTTATLIPTTATMFVPGNDALTHLSATATGAYNFDPFIIPYHILPQRLTF
ncbi:FAS1 domain-containing protein [Cynara cardunculus var. scolymus]|uniref:FAS1 domain-containing protein n=1 Tax=Cynara cardunculus var. scolymus TaxID=59895 RepID=A0A103Y1K5_CYNCS|nr:FAS1 domain-containing protein [Cynara cardunculus var. scolymus]